MIWDVQNKGSMIILEGEAEEKVGVQGSAEAVKEAVLALADDVVGIRLVSQEVGPVTTTDIDTAAAVGASILAFNVKYANAAVEGIAKLREVPVVQQNIIYRLLEQVCHWQRSPFLVTCLSHILSAPESSRTCSSHGFAALTQLVLARKALQGLLDTKLGCMSISTAAVYFDAFNMIALGTSML